MNIANQFDQIHINTSYKRQVFQCLLDTFQKKLVQVTPEEIIRQKTAIYFNKKLETPENMIFTEQALTHWVANQPGRADIVIGRKENDEIHAVAVIECKEPMKQLTAQVYEQCYFYANTLAAEYLIITNGIDIRGWHLNEQDDWDEMSVIPSYYDMLNKNISIEKSIEDEYIRYTCKELFDISVADLYETGYIGEDTPKELMPHIINFAECLYDTRYEIKPLKLKNFEIIEDLGVSYRGYNDASGGGFGTGDYRSILIKDKQDNNQIINIGIQVTGKTQNDPRYGNRQGQSVLVISIQDFEVDWMIVQINLNKYLKIHDNKMSLFHNGSLPMKNARKDELISIINSKNSKMIFQNQIYLGDFPSNKLLYIDDPEAESLIENLIEYTLLRYEYKLNISKKNKSEREKYCAKR